MDHTIQPNVVQGSTVLASHVIDNKLGKQLANQKLRWAAKVPGCWAEPREIAQPEGMSETSTFRHLDELKQFPAPLISLLSTSLGFLHCCNKY